MNNNFYFFKTKRMCLFVFSMLYCCFCSSLHAQFTHKWNAATGNWNTAANWQVFTNTGDNAVIAGATTTVISFATDLTSTVAVGDYVQSGSGNSFVVNSTFVAANTVTAISFTSPNTTITMKLPMTAAPAAGVKFSFQRPTSVGATVPNNANNSIVLIDSGICTLDDSKSVKGVVVGNTDSTAGTLQIASSGILNFIAAGQPPIPNLSIRGGTVQNDGDIRSTATASDGAPLNFSNGVAPIVSGTWGLTGTGKLTLGNSNATPYDVGFIKIDQTDSVAPEIFINANSTATLISAGHLSKTYPMINLGANAKGRIRGVGFTGPATCPLFRTGSGSTLTIDSGVTLKSTFANIASSITGSIVNNGIVINDGLIPVTVASGSITGTGTVVLKSNQINGFILTLSGASLLAIAVGDTYTLDGVTYTVANYARPVNGTTRLLVTANSNKGFAQNAVLTKVSGTGDATITCTAVVSTGTGYITYNTNSSNTINIKQEYYLRSNQRGWRLLANSLSDTTFGAVATGSTTPITLGANTASTYDSANNTWANANTDDTQTWGSKSASLLFVRGRADEVTGTAYSVNPPSNVTLAITGTTNNPQPAALATTATKYYVVSNPYTAPVSLFSIRAASTNLSNTVSYYDPTIGSNGTTDLILKKGGYRTIVMSAAAAGDANDIIIPAMGTIFVLASTNGTINIPRTAIFTGPVLNGANFNLKTAQPKAAEVDLKFDVTSTNTFFDAVSLRFKPVGDAGTNINFGKQENTILNAYSISGNAKMAVSELELKQQLIPIGINTSIESNYNIQVTTNTVPDSFVATLVDNFLNTRTVLTGSTTYGFTVSSDPASQGDNRFAIDVQAKTLSVNNKELGENIQFWPNPASEQINISNSNAAAASDTVVEISSLDGKNIYSQILKAGSTTVVPTSNWAKGIYIIKMSSEESKISKKLIIQ